MKRDMLLLILLAIALFGCTTHYSANYNYSANGTAGINSSAAPSSTQPSGTKANNTIPAVGANVSEATVNKSGTSPAGADLSGKTYSDLLVLGSPSQCSVSYVYTNSSEAAITQNFNLYFDGYGSMRMEEPATGSSDCPSSVAIFKGDASGNGTYYLSCPGTNQTFGTDFNTDEPCDWMSMDISTDYGGIGNAGMGVASYTTPGYSNIPATSYKCQPWTLDSSKFDNAGHVCK